MPADVNTYCSLMLEKHVDEQLELSLDIRCSGSCTKASWTAAPGAALGLYAKMPARDSDALRGVESELLHDGAVASVRSNVVGLRRAVLLEVPEQRRQPRHLVVRGRFVLFAVPGQDGVTDAPPISTVRSRTDAIAFTSTKRSLIS